MSLPGFRDATRALRVGKLRWSRAGSAGISADVMVQKPPA
jgi:hypothetical protein